ncbi:hypothetical protein [Desulfoluna spongiiphila]|uniref:Uncharacterized protein n=1 Tax=Desulfoluna spongiiphila TaxID=419481 RepID=A0A1G5G401_9BACT|nr:hypothetical protein [Desulfoluna spongiiphila]SCY45970.1 hypothetical protein SAMN05216233_109186 [Desulfoluna spongiiphila]
MFLTAIASSASHILGRMALAVASEKILTRLVILGLKKLAKQTTNTVDDELVGMVATELSNRNLPEAEEV